MRTKAALLIASLLFAVTFPATVLGKERSEMLVSTEWLARHLSDPQVVVLHVVKDKAHYTAGHIPGARLVALEDLAVVRAGVPNEMPPAAQLKELFGRLGVGDDTRVVLYGETAGLYAARAWGTLDYLGHGERAALLNGGLEKWRAEKRPVTTDVPQVTPRQFTPRVRPETLVEFSAVRDLSWQALNVVPPGVVLIDARPPEEFTGAKPSEGIKRPGHIPGAISVFWMQALRSPENPVLKTPAELRKLFQAAAAGRDKVVTYCRTGVQSSHAYFVAKYLGYNVAMYDGSYIEWSNIPETSVVK